jgi:hypothetical protein
VSLPDALVGTTLASPIETPDGAVALTPGSANETTDPSGDYTLLTLGSHTLTWSTTVTVGHITKVFSGTATQTAVPTPVLTLDSLADVTTVADDPVSGPTVAYSITRGGIAQLSATELPAGVTLDPATGTFTGTPTAVGTFSVKYRVAWAADPSVFVEKGFTWRVDAAGSAAGPTVTGPSNTIAPFGGPSTGTNPTGGANPAGGRALPNTGGDTADASLFVVLALLGTSGLAAAAWRRGRGRHGA